MSYEQPPRLEGSPISEAAKREYLQYWIEEIEDRLQKYPFPEDISTVRARFEAFVAYAKQSSESKKYSSSIPQVTFVNDLEFVTQRYGWMRDLIIRSQLGDEARQETPVDPEHWDLELRNWLAEEGNYRFVGAFHGGIAVAKLGRTHWTYIRRNGSKIAEEVFALPDEIEDEDLNIPTFEPAPEQEFVCVPWNGKWNFMNRDGKMLLPAGREVDLQSRFFGGAACVLVGDKWQWINKLGQVIFERLEGDSLPGEKFSEGMMPINSPEGANFLLLDGKMLYDKPQPFTVMKGFSEGYAVVRYPDGRYNFLRADGSTLFPKEQALEANLVGSFKEGLAVIERSGESFFLTRAGKPWPSEGEVFDAAHAFDDGMAFVRRGRKVNYLKRDGTYALREFQEGTEGIQYNDGAICIEQMGKYRYYRTDGTKIIPKEVPPGRLSGQVTEEQRFAFSADEASYFICGRALVQNRGKYNFLKKDGNWLVPWEQAFDSAENFCEGVAEVARNSTNGSRREYFDIDVDGNKIFDHVIEI